MSGESDSNSDSSSDICGFCGGTPCDWEAMQGTLVERGDKLRTEAYAASMKKVRRVMCQLYVYLKFGSHVMARIVRVPERWLLDHKSRQLNFMGLDDTGILAMPCLAFGHATCSQYDGVERLHDHRVFGHHVLVMHGHETLNMISTSTARARILHPILSPSYRAQKTNQLPTASCEHVLRGITADDVFNRLAIDGPLLQRPRVLLLSCYQPIDDLLFCFADYFGGSMFTYNNRTRSQRIVDSYIK
ncbi:hypothetical protein PHYPSEUDO_004213 [Phytophthora pseudosyringae]|uniref:Uncharacterized protein n=1 Tax=Phytophthora pseudosyringae TaxID=221518 RepID=A0A8T1VNW4_9STRA|nr:hypothetical protein PHYPSEUDO_004213 [Phytophthora pseudosyringae]